MATIESVRTSVDVNIKANGKQEITGVVLNSVLNNMVDLSENAESTLKSHGVLLEKHSETLEQKANEDGKYPQLTSGFANNLVGRGEAIDATINFRASGGMSIEDGAARVKELHGNSVVWNNLAKKQSNGNAVGVSATWEDNVLHVSGDISREGDPNIYSVLKPVSVSAGEKYAIIAGGSKQYMVFPYGAMTIGLTSSQAIAVATKSGEALFSLRPLENYTIGATINEYIKPCVVNLTKMFGAGNEPTTLEEFYARIPQNVDLYAYNEGEIVSTDADGIKSVGFNAWDEEWENGTIVDFGEVYNANSIISKNYIPIIPNASYLAIYTGSVTGVGNMLQVGFWDADKNFIGRMYPTSSFVPPTNAKYMKVSTNTAANIKTYNHDICIHLVHTGYRNGEYQPYMQFIRNLDTRIKEAFPNGLRSAGNAHDKVYNKNGKGIIEKRIGVVDMGTLNWTYYDGRFYSNILTDIGGTLGETYLNVVSSRYENSMSTSNKTFFVYKNGIVYVYDSAYTDAATFKAALSGVMLYYELAEPIITEYDEPFNLDYEVWDFGTEQMIASKPSAPIKAKIAYGFNAVDSVRTAQIEIAELKTQIAQMQTLMASLTASPAMLEE